MKSSNRLTRRRLSVGYQRQLHQRRRELDTLQELMLAISGERDLATLLDTITQRTRDLFSSDAAAILLVEPGGDELRIAAASGMSTQGAASRHISRADSYVPLLPSDDQVLYEPDILSRWPDGADAAQEEGLRSVLSAPLFVDHTLLGYLSIYSRSVRRFSSDERRMLATLGRYAGQGIANAQRYERERAMTADLQAAYAELLRTVNELEQAQQQLVRGTRLRVLGELASGVAHDFNNLLGGILGNAQMLLQETSGPQRDLLRVIEQAAFDGQAIVRRIREYTDERASQPHAAVDVIEVVDGALAIARPRWHRAQQAGAVVHVAQDIRTYPLVRGCAAELREVLINLLVNALDAMPLGGTLTLRVDTVGDATSSGGWVLLEVADTGVGIPPALLTAIFEPFFTTKPAGEGSGLGLSICKTIIDQHGGSIHVESALGAGTRFTIMLPALNEG